MQLSLTGCANHHDSGNNCYYVHEVNYNARSNYIMTSYTYLLVDSSRRSGRWRPNCFVLLSSERRRPETSTLVPPLEDDPRLLHSKLSVYIVGLITSVVRATNHSVGNIQTKFGTHAQVKGWQRSGNFGWRNVDSNESRADWVSLFMLHQRADARYCYSNSVCRSVCPSVRRSVCHVSALCRNGLTRHPTFFSSAIAQVFPALNIFAKFRRFPPPPYEHVENRITGGYIILPFSVKSAATKGVTNISSPWKFRLRHSFPISHFCLFIIQI